MNQRQRSKLDRFRLYQKAYYQDYQRRVSVFAATLEWPLAQVEHLMFASLQTTLEAVDGRYVHRRMTPSRRRRPKSEAQEVELKIRLDAKTVEHLRGNGAGWKTRVNALLGQLVEAGRI